MVATAYIAARRNMVKRTLAVINVDVFGLDLIGTSTIDIVGALASLALWGNSTFTGKSHT
jgi:hypothetical protein